MRLSTASMVECLQIMVFAAFIEIFCSCFYVFSKVIRRTASHAKISEPFVQMKGLNSLLVRMDNRLASSLSIDSNRPNLRPVYICRRALARVDPKVRHTTSQHWGLKVGDYIHEIRKNKSSFNFSPYCRTSRYRKTPLNDSE